MSHPRDGIPDERARVAAVTTGSSPIPLRRLWVGVALAPLIWITGEIVGYYFSSRSCEPMAGGIPLLGTARPALTHVLIELAAAIVAASGLFAALRSWRATRGLDKAGTPRAASRAHFMAFSGMALSGLFLLGILLFGFSGFVVNACSQAR
jgi:hypothetical protein